MNEPVSSTTTPAPTPPKAGLRPLPPGSPFRVRAYWYQHRFTRLQIMEKIHHLLNPTKTQTKRASRLHVTSWELAQILVALEDNPPKVER